MSIINKDLNKENAGVTNRYRKKSSIPLNSLKSDDSTDSNSLTEKLQLLTQITKHQTKSNV